MKINIRNNSGITLATVLIAIILMIVILSSIIYTSNQNSKAKQAMILNNDIEELTRRVNLYYLQNGTIPLDEDFIFSPLYDEADIEMDKEGEIIYYRLLTSVFDNLNLTNKEDVNRLDDGTEIIKKCYAINKETHSIYYVEYKKVTQEDGTKKMKWVPAVGKYSEEYEEFLKEANTVITLNKQPLDPTTIQVDSGEILKFKIRENEAIVTGLTEYGKTISNLELVIPKYYKGKPVTSINAYAFDNCDNIVSVTAPNTVTTIGMRALSYCDSLKKVDMIGVTHFANRVFMDSFNLESIVLDFSKPIYIGEKNFYRCINLKLDLTNLNWNQTTIGDSIFFGCKKVTGVVNLEGITSVGETAFYTANITGIINYESLRIIKAGAFKGTNITGSLDLSKVQKISREAFEDCINLTGEINLEGLKGNQNVIYSRTFKKTGITSVVGADHIVKIENSGNDYEEYGAFYGCKNLISIDLQNVEKIEKNSFRACENLKDVGTLENVTEIEEYAFHGCKKLNPAVEINLSNVEYIGVGAFVECNEMVIENLNLINLQGSSVVTYFKKDELAYYIDGTPVIDSATGEQKVGPIKVVSKLIGEIGEETFNHCENIKNIIIPENIKRIGVKTFNWCHRLQTVNLPSTIEYIGSYAFNGCGRSNGTITFNINMSEADFKNIEKAADWNVEILNPKYNYLVSN